MKFERVFTTEGLHPFNTVTWKNFNSSITNKEGKKVFEQQNVEFPEFWDQTSVDIVCEKYFAGSTPKNREYSLKQLITRVVGWYYEKGLADKYFDTEEDAEVFKDELTYLMLYQYAAFNSPVYFNVGVRKDPQVSACFILSADDTMDSISDNMKIEMSIFRGGSGAGLNRSKLRSSKERVSTGGTAMGPLVPIEISDKIAKATKSGGKTRRSALMMELDIDHGDIEQFIVQKAQVEKAAKILIKEGWSADFDDPNGVYSLLGLQNFNQSVSIPDSFMQCLISSQQWALLERYPTNLPDIDKKKLKTITTFQGDFFEYEGNWYLEKKDGCIKVIKWVKARDLWNMICESAWECADPGVQFRTHINNWHTCKADGEITGSNPCSEYFFLEDTSCNLASLNLLKFLEGDSFNISKFKQAVRIFITAMDISVHNASYPTKHIKEKTKLYRTLGLGYTNLGALLLSKTLPYDSEEGRKYAAAITALLLSFAYSTSQELGSQLGPFERYEANKEYMSEVLAKHLSYMEKLKNDLSFSKINEDIKTEISYIIGQAIQNFPSNHLPVRNAQVVVIAPTGTISFMMGAETTGIEPVLGLTYYKKMVGGGFIELTVPSVKRALLKLGYTDREINIIFKSLKNDPESLFSLLDAKHLPLLQTSFSSLPQLTLSPSAHVEMMAAVQPFISGGISKTVNLPYNATKEDIDKIFMTAWRLGLKSISVYRDGCKGSQPLSLDKSEKLLSNGRPKPIRKVLPDDRPGYNHKFRIGNQKGFLQFGFYPDTHKLGEMYAEISKGGSTLNGLVNTIAILVSIMLQYGVPPEEIIDAFENLQFEPSGFTSNPNIPVASSIPDYIAKYMRHLLSSHSHNLGSEKKKEEYQTGETCPNCGNLMVRTGTCYTCTHCGSTGGCG
jgi:ribonucleoside-diphosphate reductase alpha chain